MIQKNMELTPEVEQNTSVLFAKKKKVKHLLIFILPKGKIKIG